MMSQFVRVFRVSKSGPGAPGCLWLLRQYTPPSLSGSRWITSVESKDAQDTTKGNNKNDNQDSGNNCIQTGNLLLWPSRAEILDRVS